jgi:hypothetical protein
MTEATCFPAFRSSGPRGTIRPRGSFNVDLLNIC